MAPTKAQRAGIADARGWLSETPSKDWAAAIAPGTLDADEGLLNALTHADAAEWLGVPKLYSPNGMMTRAAVRACRQYSASWKATVARAIKNRVQP